MPRRTKTNLDAFEPSERIDGCQPRRTTVRWPEPVFAHLDVLVAEARAKTDRQELAAALICSTPADRATLRRALELFRDGTIEDLAGGNGER